MGRFDILKQDDSQNREIEIYRSGFNFSEHEIENSDVVNKVTETEEEIIRTAIITYCVRIVVVHNHPSRRYNTKYRRLTVYRKIKTYFRNIRNRIIRSCNNRRWRI